MYQLIFEIFPVRLMSVDHDVAMWFHEHLTDASSSVLMSMSDPGSAACVGSLTVLAALLLTWKRMWHSLASAAMAVPGGMLLNEVLKVTIRRERPFQTSPYIDVTGYSFPSAHTMAATLIYGLLVVLVVSVVKARRWRMLVCFAASCLVLMVAFSRVALGAHYMTDVVAAIIASIAWLYFSVGVAGRLRQYSLARSRGGGGRGIVETVSLEELPD